MLKICHISDIHVSNTRRFEYAKVFNQLFESIKQNNISTIVVAGDLFHEMSKATAYCWSAVGEFLCKLQSLAPTVVIPGNHDMNLRSGNEDLISPLFFAGGGLRNLKNIVYFRNSGVYQKFGITWIIKAPDQDFPELPDISPGPVICLLHETINTMMNPNTNKIKEKLTEMATKVPGLAIMLGDLHIRQEITIPNAKCWYSGSLVCQNIVEELNHGWLEWIYSNGWTIREHNIRNDNAPVKIRYSEIDKVEPSNPNYYTVITEKMKRLI